VRVRGKSKQVAKFQLRSLFSHLESSSVRAIVSLPRESEARSEMAGLFYQLVRAYRLAGFHPDACASASEQNQRSPLLSVMRVLL
jgi:hypothetical protein